MLQDQKIKNFLDDLSSKSPTPGGGSVAALAGALGAALLLMVCNLTIGKEKYIAVEDNMRMLLKNAGKLRFNLETLINEDIDAFNQFMVIFKMPRETEEQKEERNKKMQLALIEAAKIPLKIAGQSKDVLDLCIEVAEKGNKNVISDAGVGAILAEAAFESAILNVNVNLRMIKDENQKTKIIKERDCLLQSTLGLKEKVLSTVNQKI